MFNIFHHALKFILAFFLFRKTLNNYNQPDRNQVYNISTPQYYIDNCFIDSMTSLSFTRRHLNFLLEPETARKILASNRLHSFCRWKIRMQDGRFAMSLYKMRNSGDLECRNLAYLEGNLCKELINVKE